MQSTQRKATATMVRPTVICLHASGGTGAQWQALAHELGSDFDVAAPNLYGHGATPAWPGPASDIVAADAARIASMVASAAGTVHLVGHSYGGAIALRVALLRSRSVASIAVYEPVTMRVLFDYNARHRAAAEVAEIAGNVRRALNGGDCEQAAERFVDYWSGAGQWGRLAPAQRSALARRMPVIDAHFKSLRNDAMRLRDYARVGAPVLYLGGRDSRASVRRIAELMAYALPDVERFTFGGMGHLGPITHEQAVARRIAGFVRRQAAGSWVHRKAA